MKTGKGGKAERLAFGAMGAAISLLGITLSYYVSVMSLTFNIIAVIGMAIPLFKQYYREAALAAVGVILIGIFWVNIKIVAFSLMGGVYCVFTVLAYDKNWNKWLLLVGKFLYSIFVCFCMFKLFAVVALDLEKLNLDKLNPTLLYILLNVVFSVTFLIYDRLYVEGVKYLRVKLKFL